MELRNSKVQEYIKEVCSQIRFKEIHDEVGLEIQSHITELADEYISEGFSEEDSINKAIAMMGDAKNVGMKLDKVHRQQPDWGILGSILMFSVIGMSVIYLLEANDIFYHGIHYSGHSPIFINSLIYNLAGAIIAFSLYFFDYKKIQPFSKIAYKMSFVLFTFAVLFCPYMKYPFENTGRSLIEASPLVFAVILSGVFDGWDWNSPKRTFKGLLILFAPTAYLLLFCHVFYSAVIYTIAAIALAIFSGLKGKYVFLVIGSGIGIIILRLINSPNYNLGVIIKYISNGHLGTVSSQMFKIIISSGIFGYGISSIPDVIPNIQTNYIFTYIVCAFGWVAGIVLIVMIITFLMRLARIAKTAKDSYGKLLVSSILTILSVQFAFNILMATGILPISSIVLPFISYGSLEYILNMIMVGLILSVYRRRNFVKLRMQN